jgi:hypothetical protein
MSYAAIEEEDSAFTTLRRQYFDITNDYCAAKLIEYFKHWTNWKMKVHRTPWIYQPLRRIQEDLIGEHSENVIRRAILRLEELGLIERRHNPGNWQDKTWQYKLNLERLSELLEDRKRRNKESNLKSEAFHRINPKASDPNNNNVAVEEEMREVRWEEVAREVELWEREQIKNLLEGAEVSDSTNEGICQGDQLSEAALKDAKLKSVTVNNDKVELEGISVAPESGNAMAKGLPLAIGSPNSAQQEEERIPRVIVTTNVPGAIAISSGTQVQEVQEQGGSSLGAVEQVTVRSAIAPTKTTQEESEPVPRVIVTTYAKGAIATSSAPQERVSKPQMPKDIASPILSSAKSQPVVPKNLTQAELNAIEDELKRLSINPDSCISVIKKYWENVGGAISRVKEAIQQGWCKNPTGLFIKSCKEGLKAQKQVINNSVKEWFEWARKERIVIAMTGEIGYTPNGEPVNLQEMMALYPMRS